MDTSKHIVLIHMVVVKKREQAGALRLLTIKLVFNSYRRMEAGSMSSCAH